MKSICLKRLFPGSRITGREVKVVYFPRRPIFLAENGVPKLATFVGRRGQRPAVLAVKNIAI